MFVHLVHYLLILHKLLPLLLLPNGLVDHVSFAKEHPDPLVDVVVLEVRARGLALEVETAFLIGLRVLLALQVAVVEHVDANEVRHLVVHHLALAKLEGEILIILVFLRSLRILPDVIQNELRVVIHHVRANGYEAELFATVHYVARALLLVLQGHRHIDLFDTRAFVPHVLRIDTVLLVLDLLGM